MKKDDKIRLLLRDGRDFYHTQDLAVLWGISNSNTLYTNIKRYTQRGILNNLFKGFYSIKPLDEIDPVALGLASLRSYGYLSTESVLAENGIIFQEIKYVTLISDVSRRLRIGNHDFLIRKMKDEYLYNDVGIIVGKKTRKASLERAVADMLYLNSNYYFDAPDSVNWEKVEEIKKAVGY